MARRYEDNDSVQVAIEKYREFHRFEPKKIVPCPGLRIPETVELAGSAVWTTYRSNKVDPGTMERPKRHFNYIHEHNAGVKVYLPVGVLGTRARAPVTVPAKWRPDPSTDPALDVLGKCLGFSYVDEDGEQREAKATAPLPELCCTPDGHCLLVVQSGKRVLAMLWGGALGVFARGIDG